MIKNTPLYIEIYLSINRVNINCESWFNTFLVKLTKSGFGSAAEEKLPTFAIGKSIKPPYSSAVKSLPLSLHLQKKSWINGNLFTEWAKEVDRKFLAQDRKIALNILICLAHPTINGFNAFKLINLPANTTSKKQPVNQNVITSLKAFYRLSLSRITLQELSRKIFDKSTRPKIL